MRKTLLAGVAAAALLSAGVAFADTVGPIDFESPAYTVGSIDGQHGWSAFGSAGHGCAVYDEGVSSTAGTGAPASFGNQSFRISNAVTSGCFSDQAFSTPLLNAAGEASADTGGFPSGTIQPHFESQFDIYAIPDSTGDVLSVSPDRGDGARMSYLRFENQADGIHVYFDDVTDPSHAMNADTFNESQIAVLSASMAHTVKFSMDFYDGPDNDVVKVYIDGLLVHTGTSWEDYYLYDTESNPGLQNEHSRTVRTMLFRAGGAAAPSNSGKGYLIDNLSLVSGPIPLATAAHAPAAKATGSITMSDPSQQIVFSAFDSVNSGQSAKGTVEYWNYDYPGGTLHYTADVLCSNVDQISKTATFIFEIPDGFPGLSGLYVGAKVLDGGTPGTKGDTYGHAATADSSVAMDWCANNNPPIANYAITSGNLVVH